MKAKLILLAATGLVALGYAGSAMAVSTISGGNVLIDPNDAITWKVVASPSSGSGYSGNEQSTIVYNYLGKTGNTLNFSYTLANTSIGGTAQGPSIAVFGFSKSGSATVAAGLGDFFQKGSGGNFNGLSPTPNTCFFSGNNCNGGGNTDLRATDAPVNGTFTLAFGSLPALVTLSNFATRFQRTGANFNGSASGFGTPVEVVGVPEPATWAMMIGGFGLLGSVARRRRRTAALAA
jgi:hypothetical protein